MVDQDLEKLQVTGCKTSLRKERVCLFKSRGVLLKLMTGGGLDGRSGTVLSNEQIYSQRDLRSHHRSRRNGRTERLCSVQRSLGTAENRREEKDILSRMQQHAGKG